MDKILILQSFREQSVSPWINRCLSSVRMWATQHNYDYLSCGDDLFERLPGWYRDKVVDRPPIAADLARLLWIQELLNRGSADVVAWLDADVFVMDRQNLQVNCATSCVFGYEYWLQQGSHDKRPRVHKNVHNAYCAFRVGCPILPFLIEAIQRMVARVDPAYLAPQFVGPKLLTSLHNIVGFELDRRVGAISPLLADALIRDDRRILTLMSELLSEPMCAANLCASLQDQQVDMNDLLDRLAEFRNGLK